jgi:hypothetical protein
MGFPYLGVIKAFPGKIQGGLDVLPFKLGIILKELIPFLLPIDSL